MRELLRRIAISGGLTALILGALGFALAEMAASTVETPLGTRAPANGPRPDVEQAHAVGAKMRSQIPLSMAIWGFVFVAVVETVRHLVRSWRAAPAVAPTPVVPDDTEKLLEELLSLAEARTAIGPPANRNQNHSAAAIHPNPVAMK
jgi:hypothetical protein